MIDRPPADPAAAWNRTRGAAERLAEAAEWLDATDLRRLAATWSPKQLEKSLEVLGAALVAAEELAEVLEGLRQARADRRAARPRPPFPIGRGDFR